MTSQPELTRETCDMCYEIEIISINVNQNKL